MKSIKYLSTILLSILIIKSQVALGKQSAKKLDAAVAATDTKNESKTLCAITKEYITVSEYLKSKKEFGLGFAQIQALVDQIINKSNKNCHGLAKRFILVTELLLKVEVTSNDALKYAMEFVPKTDSHVDTFIGIFQRSYLASYLDLDLMTSIKIALDLSLDYQGPVKNAMDDYFKIVSFCLEKNKVNISLPDCSRLAREVVEIGESYKFGGADSFIYFYNYVRDQNQKNFGLNIGKTLYLGKEICALGEGSVENFIQAYQYALKVNGMNLSAESSLKFAKHVIGLKKANDDRLPASTTSKIKKSKTPRST